MGVVGAENNINKAEALFDFFFTARVRKLKNAFWEISRDFKRFQEIFGGLLNKTLEKSRNFKSNLSYFDLIREIFFKKLLQISLSFVIITFVIKF